MTNKLSHLEMQKEVACTEWDGSRNKELQRLEESVKSLQDRNYSLLEASEILQRQNLELSGRLSPHQEAQLRSELAGFEAIFILCSSPLRDRQITMHLEMRIVNNLIYPLAWTKEK